jgi:hypothetical protein
MKIAAAKKLGNDEASLFNPHDDTSKTHSMISYTGLIHIIQSDEMTSFIEERSHTTTTMLGSK